MCMAWLLATGRNYDAVDDKLYPGERNGQDSAIALLLSGVPIVVPSGKLWRPISSATRSERATCLQSKRMNEYFRSELLVRAVKMGSNTNFGSSGRRLGTVFRLRDVQLTDASDGLRVDADSHVETPVHGNSMQTAHNGKD